MIICPNCKEEIEDSSHYCDQCGQVLHYCNRCGRVGLGRRCTNCGGMMVNAEDLQSNVTSQTAYSFSNPSMRREPYSISIPQSVIITQPSQPIVPPYPHQNGSSMGIPSLLLTNDSLGIRIEAINGSVIGRKQGPYSNYFHNNMYVSGVHAQLRFKANSGWCIVDMHSSNGTKLNGHPVQPDVEMSMKDGDIITIANISLQITIK